MLDNTPIAVWVLAAFAGSCVGVGFASGYLARHRAWGAWRIGLGSIGGALLWPVILLVAFLVTRTGHCEPSAGDPCDAPARMLGIIITVFMPLLFVISFVLALSGGIIAWFRFRLDAPPNKSLDASGGSVFRIMTGPAMLE